MPTHGTHTPDVPYEPSSVMAWGPRGDQNFKSYNDQIYEQRVRAKTRDRTFVRSTDAPSASAIADVPFPSPAAASQCKATKTSHNWNSINLRTEECAPSRASPARDSDRPLARANETETLRLPVVPTDRPTDPRARRRLVSQ